MVLWPPVWRQILLALIPVLENLGSIAAMCDINKAIKRGSQKNFYKQSVRAAAAINDFSQKTPVVFLLFVKRNLLKIEGKCTLHSNTKNTRRNA